ncbi:hypothetical protein RF55_3188 [Lasius niger]|uniref:Uncharacterized protein n=1 Tax=Lasius niger TaxID=67767 RepID=A0A0J7L1N5_LASNI|nr:hypothetical protein RF55_3188 [Lasius niger]
MLVTGVTIEKRVEGVCVIIDEFSLIRSENAVVDNIAEFVLGRDLEMAVEVNIGEVSNVVGISVVWIDSAVAVTADTSELLLILKTFGLKCVVVDSIVKVVGTAELVEVVSTLVTKSLDEIAKLVLGRLVVVEASVIAKVEATFTSVDVITLESLIVGIATVVGIVVVISIFVTVTVSASARLLVVAGAVAFVEEIIVDDEISVAGIIVVAGTTNAG